MNNPKQPITNPKKSNNDLMVERFIEANEKFRTLLPEIHDLILNISPFAQNKILVSNAWSRFKEMDNWIAQIMKEAFDTMKEAELKAQETKDILSPTKNNTEEK